MKSYTAAIMLSWFFFYYGYGGTIVGPFNSEKQCERIRAAIGSMTTPCWSDW